MCAAVTISSALACVGRYYLDFLGSDKAIKMLSQLNVELKEWKKTLTDINDVHKLSSEPTGSQTSTKGAEKIISALQELEKSQKQVKFVMDYQSLGIIPGHSSDSLAATASIFESMAIATSRAVEKLAREPPVNNVQQTQPASKTNQSTVNKPVKSYAKVVQKGKKKTKTTIANNNSNQKVKRSKTPAVRTSNESFPVSGESFPVPMSHFRFR